MGGEDCESILAVLGGEGALGWDELNMGLLRVELCTVWKVDINDPHFVLSRLGERGVVEDPENVTWQGTPRFCM